MASPASVLIESNESISEQSKSNYPIASERDESGKADGQTLLLSSLICMSLLRVNQTKLMIPIVKKKSNGITHFGMITRIYVLVSVC